jgi:hypothetical protein
LLWESCWSRRLFLSSWSRHVWISRRDRHLVLSRWSRHLLLSRRARNLVLSRLLSKIRHCEPDTLTNSLEQQGEPIELLFTPFQPRCLLQGIDGPIYFVMSLSEERLHIRHPLIKLGIWKNSVSTSGK